MLCAIFLCGCSDYREIDRGYLVNAIGIGFENDKTNIFISAVSSSDIADNPYSPITLSAYGENILDAYKNLQLQLEKPLYFEHLGTIVLEDTNHLEFISFFAALPMVNPSALVVKTPSCKSLFSNQDSYGLLGYDIIGIIKNYENQNKVNFTHKMHQLDELSLTSLPTIVLENNALSLLERKEQL